MTVLPAKSKFAAGIALWAGMLSGINHLPAQTGPPAGARQGMMHTEWVVLPQRAAANLLRKARFSRTDAGSVREEVLGLIRSGQGRVAARDAMRIRTGEQEWSAGTDSQLPDTYTVPRMSKGITVNAADETTDPVEPALVQTTTTVFSGRRTTATLAATDGGLPWCGLYLQWLTPQGEVIWGEGKSAMAFPLTHEMSLQISGVFSSGTWVLAGMTEPPVTEDQWKPGTGALYVKSPDERVLVFVKVEVEETSPPAPAIVPAVREESPGCLLEWWELEDDAAADLLERFPVFTDPAVQRAMKELAGQGKAWLADSLWVPADAGLEQRVGSRRIVRIPYSYELVIPWRIHRTAGPLLPLGPARKPWWLPPVAKSFERTEIPFHVSLTGGTMETTIGREFTASLRFSKQQLTGMMEIGLPGLAIAAPVWQGAHEFLEINLIPGRPTLVQTFEAHADPSSKPWTTAPKSGRKCWLFLTAVEGSN